MIFKFFKFLRPVATEIDQSTAVTIYKDDHNIDINDISPSARKTIDKLQANGFVAFIVGGAVRDLLLGLTPKDFDIATSATPEEVKKLFKRSRIIGRRFRLVHVYSGRDILEISTFRAAVNQEQVAKFVTDDKGRILRDNVFGTQEEDALRRDFTVNALFYDPVEEIVTDYISGYRDLLSKKLRIIGIPRVRFREDPVRLLRAVRLSSKLGLEIEKDTLKSMRFRKKLLLNVPPSRLFEEMLKIFFCGKAVDAIFRLKEEGLLEILMPEAQHALRDESAKKFLLLALSKTDQRVETGQPNSPSFILAAILWNEIFVRWRSQMKSRKPPFSVLVKVVDNFFLSRPTKGLGIPRRIEMDVRKIWLMQARFLKTRGRHPHALLRSLRFRAGYDFMLLRCESGQENQEQGLWWTRFIKSGSDERLEMTGAVFKKKDYDALSRKRKIVR